MSDQTAMPPASTFDFLPPLHRLLSRLLAQQSSLSIPDGQDGGSISGAAGVLPADPSSTSAPGISITATDIPTSSAPTAAPELGTSAVAQPHAASTLPDPDGRTTYTDLAPLEIQHLASEAARVKVRVHKARQAVAALPDVARPVGAQEEEIAALEARCAALRAVLAGMAARAVPEGAGVARDGRNGAAAIKSEPADVEMAGA